MQGQKLQDYVNAQVNNKPAEKLKKPFAAVATNLDTGDRAVFVRGNVGQAMKSISMAPPRDLYTKFLHQTEPARRARR